MAITRTILNVQSDYKEDLPMARPMFSDWDVQQTDSPKPGSQETVYKYMGGDPAYPATIRIGVYDNDNGRSVSGRFDTWEQYTNDDGDILYKKMHVVVAFFGEDPGAWTADGSNAAIDNLLMFTGFVKPLSTPALSAGGGRENTAYNRVKYGVTEFDPGGIDDPAEA